MFFTIFLGAFRKVTKGPGRPKSVKANDSFWEPDNDTYVDPNPSKILSLPKCPNVELPISKPQPKELRLAKDERRQSIEEFIEMGLSNPTSPTKVYIEALDQIPLPPVELGTRDSKKIVIKVDDLDSLKGKGKVLFLLSLPQEESRHFWALLITMKLMTPKKFPSLARL